MNKVLYNKRYEFFREVLMIERVMHKISQKQLAKKLGVNQSYVSKTEIGIRRLDVLELLDYCDAMELTLTDFVFRMEGRLLAEGMLSPKRKKEYLRWLTIYREYNKQCDNQKNAELMQFPEKKRCVPYENEKNAPLCTRITFSTADMPELATPVI